MERARRVLPRGILLSAAALLLVALLVAIYMLSPGTPELAHVQVAKKFDDEYTICADKGRGAPRRGDREDVLRAIARDLKNKKIDLKLVELPYVADADYCGSCTQTFKFADGVEVEGLRLDFVTQKEAGPGAVICVFMLPTDAFPPRSKLLKGLSKPHYCACVPGMRNTIFCLATESSVFHFVTDLEKDIFKNTHTPSVEPLLASR